MYKETVGSCVSVQALGAGIPDFTVHRVCVPLKSVSPRIGFIAKCALVRFVFCRNIISADAYPFSGSVLHWGTQTVQEKVVFLGPVMIRCSSSRGVVASALLRALLTRQYGGDARIAFCARVRKTYGVHMGGQCDIVNRLCPPFGTR